MPKRIVLIGGAGHASDLLGVIEAMNEAAQAAPTPWAEVVGIVADGAIDPKRFVGRGVERIGSIDDLKHIDATHYVMGIGYSQPRRTVQKRMEPFALMPLTLVHPRAWVHPSASIGAGTVVLAGAVVSAMAVIGDHCVIHHNSVIGHDAQLQDFVTVLPGASVSGDTLLEEACAIGSRAVVIEKRTVGADAIVGAGAIVSRDLPPGVVATGVPARWSDA